jgi:acyl-CoA synthetase (AMP-forming)/AMP-acid ligase II
MNIESLFASTSLTEALRAAAEHHGDRPAISRGEETWSYRQLGRRITELRDALAATPGPLLFSPSNSPTSVAAIMGAIAAGRVPVLPDPTWTDAERLEVARRCGIRAVLSEVALEAAWLTNPRRAAALHLYDVSLPADEADAVTPRPETAFCRFTSGTTGFSRCLEFTHRAALAAAHGWWRAVRYADSDVVLCLATLNNGLAFNTSLLAVLLPGAHLVFHAGPLIPSALAATSRRHPPTALVAFPFVYDALAIPAARHRLDAQRLRLAVSSAAPLKPASSAAFAATYGVAVANYYGLVEAGPCTFNDGSVPGSVGYCLEGVEFRLAPVDLTGAPRPDGGGDDHGRLCVRSAAMASGFLDRRGPPLGEALDGDGYYVTNDLAELTASGHLRLHGRIGRLINIEGRKIDPGEVEGVIRLLPGVTDALVREESANGRVLLAAYVESGGVGTDQLVDAFCHHLAPYKRPQRIRVMPRFPRSAAGKVLLSQLTTGDL